MTRQMISRLPSLAFVALLAATPVLAQDTGAATADAPAQDEAAPAATQAQATPSETAPAESELGQSYYKDVSGDWQILCVNTELSDDPCRLHQLLKDAAGNNVATVEVVDLADQPGAAGLTIVTPLDTLLTENVTVSIDGGPGQKMPFEFCTPRGCVVRIALSAENVNVFKRGNKAVMTIVPAAARDQRVDLEVSLSGFTAGLSKTTELNELATEALRKAQAEAQSAN